VEKARELGIGGLDDKQKAVGQALLGDANFIRLGKGAYSLHAYHPDKEQLVRAPQPKKRKLEEVLGEQRVLEGSGLLSVFPWFAVVIRSSWAAFMRQPGHWVQRPQVRTPCLSHLPADGEEPASKRQEGGASGAAADGEEVDSITRAEQQLRQAQRALRLHRAELEKAQVGGDLLVVMVEAWRLLACWLRYIVG
jgi:hypothetical protein